MTNHDLAVLGVASPTLAKALVAAQRAASAVAKASVNSHQRYRYASADSMISEARAALTAAGVGVYATRCYVKNQRMYVRYVVVHESGEWFQSDSSTAIIPGNGRPQDKAESTALTYNLAYFLRGLLLLPRVEAGTDVDQRDDRPKAAAARGGNGGNGKGLAALTATMKQERPQRRPQPVRV